MGNRALLALTALVFAAGLAGGQEEGPPTADDDITPTLEATAYVPPGEPPGSGGGRFSGRVGHRNLKAMGGNSRTEAALERALDWLARHQEADGGWVGPQTAGCCGDDGRPPWRTGVSSLALLAFQGSGESHRRGPRRDAVRLGLRYLLSTQGPDGQFGNPAETRNIYNHALALAALADAYGMTASALLVQPVREGIRWLGRAQNPYLAWRYGIRPQQNDTSVTSFAWMALRIAEDAGFEVDQACFEGVRAWLEKVTVPDTGVAGYLGRGDARHDPPTPSAMALFMRSFYAHQDRKQHRRWSAWIEKGLLPPPRAWPVDLCYLHFGVYATFHMGGEHWRPWNQAMQRVLLPEQKVIGCARGSWDPAGPYGSEGGRVYATAMAALCLEVYYRYTRCF